MCFIVEIVKANSKTRVATGDMVAPTKKMKKSKNYFGNPLTMREGPHPCRGSVYRVTDRNKMSYTTEQAVWMKENKPLYYTGDLFKDIHHLPLALRSL